MILNLFPAAAIHLSLIVPARKREVMPGCQVMLKWNSRQKATMALFVIEYESNETQIR